MKRIKLSWVVVCAACLAAGCGIIPPEENVALFHKRYREGPPTVDQTLYKSPQARPNQDDTLALGVAISGGGHRAANFGMGVLLALESFTAGSGRKVNLLREIDYLSTVSGGGFCGAGYVSSLHYHLLDSHPADKSALKRAYESYSLQKAYDGYLKNALRRNYEWTLLGSVANPANWFRRVNRGDAMEKIIDNSLLRYKQRRKKNGNSLRLSDMFIHRDSSLEPRLPWLVTNGSVYRNRSIFPFSPDVVRAHLVAQYVHRRRKVMIQHVDADRENRGTRLAGTPGRRSGDAQ